MKTESKVGMNEGKNEVTEMMILILFRWCYHNFVNRPF